MRLVPEAALAADREYRVGIAPVEERERVLHPLVAGEPSSFGDLDGRRELFGCRVGRADRADLSVADELVERRQGLLERRVRVMCVRHVERNAVDAETLEARLDLAADAVRGTARGRRPSAIGLNVFVWIVIASRTSEPFSASHSPIHVSLRPPPYASAVSNVVIPSSQAASMIRGASSRGMPWPKSAGAEPTPPKFPQPRMIRVTEIPLRPSSRVSTPRS